MIDEEYIKKIIKTINNKVEKIDFTDTNTIIDFADGEKMILHGGKNMVGKIKKIPKCSFCDEEKTDKNIMISPDNNENILICPKCSAQAVEMFVQRGVEIDLKLPYIKKPH